METEIWEDISGYEGLYQASNLGKIRNYKNKNILKGQIINSGYIVVNLYKNKKRKAFLIHRLVAKIFIPNLENKEQVNHINGIKNDNRVENLEWCTRSENMKHSFQILGRKVNKGMLGKCGMYNKKSKKINQYDLEGNFIKTWHGIRQTGFELGIGRHSIIRVCNGKLKTAGGFIWQYKN